MKKVVTAFLFMFLLGGALAYAQASKAKLEIVTTLFPTYDFAKQIGKDKVNVSLLLPPGVESHTFELKPADVVRISKADIFIYTGKYMEPWAEDMLKGVSNKNLIVIDASKGIELAGEEGHDEEPEHHGGGKDPHIWVDLGKAQIMVNTIATALTEKDQVNKAFYLKNAKEYNAKLADLDERFKETLSTCKHKTIIYGGHFAFGYFAKRYGLEHVSPYDGFSPNAEPSPKALAELINKLKASGMKYIYYEELLDPKVARVISQETGANLELLHGAHNVSKDELSRGCTFIDIMEDNLKKLRVGLECQ
ncbi:MAG: zinc ABC transporter substrate-binding protein [Candidatus Omnitrophica bacterium]|nr:zinc ABC transporter substrate-binding protein [Candidatus Omnitrophota bacterium]MBU4467606.1 zinc ABC transporter substrate-binding protein [Candidatus Omnitrophota bacterium]